jgi:hypothetical protein
LLSRSRLSALLWQPVSQNWQHTAGSRPSHTHRKSHNPHVPASTAVAPQRQAVSPPGGSGPQGGRSATQQRPRTYPRTAACWTASQILLQTEVPEGGRGRQVVGGSARGAHQAFEPCACETVGTA